MRFYRCLNCKQTQNQMTDENKLLIEIETKNKTIADKNIVIDKLTQENGYLNDEIKRFEKLKQEFEVVNQLRDKEEISEVPKMQEEILMLSQIKTVTKIICDFHSCRQIF